MKKIHNLYAIIVAILVFFLDRLTKYFAENINGSIPIINNIFNFTLVYNTGAGFGILKGARIFFIIFSIVVIAGIIYKWKKIPENVNITIPLGLIIGGLLGNLYDRLFLGYVIDFLDFRIWPVFNIADSCITIAAIWLIFYLWKK